MGLCNQQKEWMDSPCLQLQPRGWEFSVECCLLSFQPSAISICPSFEISFGFLLLTKGSKTSVAAPIDSILAFPSFPQHAPFGCFVSKS